MCAFTAARWPPYSAATNFGMRTQLSAAVFRQMNSRMTLIRLLQRHMVLRKLAPFDPTPADLSRAICDLTGRRNKAVLVPCVTRKDCSKAPDSLAKRR